MACWPTDAFRSLAWLVPLPTLRLAFRAPASTAAPATLATAGGHTVVALALTTGLTSLLLLSTGMMPTLPATERGRHVTLAVVGVAAAWGLLHMVFTLCYAHLYYDTATPPGGLLFPEETPRQPDYLDFAYFAFVVGMAAQTADVVVTRPLRRRAVLRHGLLSFAFNTAVVALSTSGLGGML